MNGAKEYMLEPAVIAFLQDIGFYNVFREVPLGSRRIDLCAVDSRERIAAVELKLRDLKGLLRQASTCRLAADLVYVAIPADQVRRLDVDLVREMGIGILSVGPGRATVVLEVSETHKPRSLRHREDLKRGIELSTGAANP